jgi:uncharacterized membrane protein
VGLLLLSMTNRLARVIDRSRLLCAELRGATGADRERVTAQLRILARRADLIRLAILLASISLLLAAVLIITLFFTALLGLEVGWLIAAMFVGCMLTLIGALSVFILDVDRSLGALKLEMAADLGDAAR